MASTSASISDYASAIDENQSATCPNAVYSQTTPPDAVSDADSGGSPALTDLPFDSKHGGEPRSDLSSAHRPPESSRSHRMHSAMTMDTHPSSFKRGQAHIHETHDHPRPNTATPSLSMLGIDTLDTSSRSQDTSNSPLTPKGGTFVKARGDMPTSSIAQLQLWDSGGSSSNTSTLVGSASRVPSHIRKHLRTTSGGTAIEGSRGSSSSASASSEQVAKGDIEVRPRPEMDMIQPHQQVLHAKSMPEDQTATISPIRHRPWVRQDRPRSGFSIRFERSSSAPGRDSRRTHSRQVSTPQLSPLMPLLFQPDLPLEMLAYTNRSARIIHTLYPLLIYMHIPFTLFLDFNVIFALAQIATHPMAEGNAVAGHSAATPRSNAWWIALAFYALSTLTWFLVVFLIHDLYYSYHKLWKNRNPPIINVFLSSPTFHLSCTRSYDIFCSLWRLRLSSFTGIGSIPPSRWQGFLEMAHLFMQNWPTIVTLVPRAFVSLALLFSFTSNSSSVSSNATFERDPAYFRPDGTLSTFSVVFNLFNVCWAVWRCLLALVAGSAYLYLSQQANSSANHAARPTTPGDSYTVVSTSWPSEFQQYQQCEGWKGNLRERIIELVLLCSSSNRWRRPRTDGNAYKESSSISNPFSRSKRKRRSTVTFQPDQVDIPEMQERPPSNLSFNVHLPARAASARVSDSVEVDDAVRELRVSSIPTRRKNKVSIDSTASSIFSPGGTAESSQSTVNVDRPFSALGHHSGQEHRYPLHTRTRPGASVESPAVVQEVDEEELERLEWEKHPPLTPRGSLVQAREELALQHKERSYWNPNSPISPTGLYLEEEEEEPAFISPEVGGIERDLHAIVEESDEEASLRRANSLSNRQTVSSRQSSLRRAPTPLNRLDDGGISVIEERSEHGQNASTSA